MRSLLLLCLPLVVPALAGCTTCQPMLEVVQPNAAPDDVPLHTWTADDGRAWPDVEAAMVTATPGDHVHDDWTRERERAFWTYFGVELDEPGKELWIAFDEEVYRVRVLTCDLRGEE